MRTAFIIIAIFAAVVLLVRFAASPVKPRFISGERITHNALINNIKTLGAKCSVTENGLGISQTINIRHIIDECKKRMKYSAADDWQIILCSASGEVLSSLSDGKKCARYSSYCAHIGKYPRIYLFCEMLVRQSDCEITRELLLNCLSAFEDNAPFDQSERKILCGMLKFCLIGHLFVKAETGIKRAEMYDKGIDDGKCGKVDLTYIHVDDYVCGLIDGCADSERSAVVGLFEYNGVDVSAADKSRRKFLAQTFVTVNSVLRSISIADECNNIICTPTKQGERAKRYVKTFNIIFPILLIVYAVFTCLFASPKYVALFSVAAILTYGVMRIPILLYADDGGINIFAPIERLIYGLFNRKNNVSLQDSNRQLLSETAYFGCEPQYMSSVIDGKLNMRCDNRGGIAIHSDENIDALHISVSSDGLTVSLSECDGVIERHRAIYRVCKGEIELCAEVLAPVDISACIVRLTVINRSAEDKTANIISAVVRNGVVACATEDIRGGAMANCYNGFALSITDGKYGGDLSAFCADGALRHARTNKPALIGVSEVSVNGFSKVDSYITVVYAQGRREAESMLRYASEDLYYSRAAVEASVYCGLDKAHKLPIANDMLTQSRKQNQVAKYQSPNLLKHGLLYELPFGGITEDNGFVIEHTTGKSIENIIANGRLSLTLNQFGVQSIAVGGQSITPPPDAYLHAPRAFVVIGEDGVMWSPTSRPCGQGETYVIHNRGYTEYTCAYNGTVCTQKCFAAKSSVFIEVTLYNKTSAERVFDIMFSALCKTETSVDLTDRGVTADNLLFCALGEHAEYALYKESYYIYGHIARTSDLRLGGSTPAPTASISKVVKANSNARVVYCITDRINKPPDIDTVADLFNNVKRYYNRLGRICAKTDDGVLNVSYTQSLYSAYTAFASKKSTSLRDESLIMNAVKYVDPIAVKNRIYEILSKQNQNGGLCGYDNCLQFLCCVTEYAQFMQDTEFLQEMLPFAAQRNRAEIKDSVYNHIIRAIACIVNYNAPRSNSIVQSIWNTKNIINILRFWEGRIKNGALSAVCKKHFVLAADEYSKQVKKLISNNFFEFGSTTEAYMCAKLLFDLDLDEKAYNIIKFNNPLERLLHYGNRVPNKFDCLYDPVSSAVYYTTVTERLFGAKFCGKTVKICPHTSRVTPKMAFDIYGKTKDAHIIIDNTHLCGNWKMRVNRINYPADSVEIGELSDDITFYRDGNE